MKKLIDIPEQIVKDLKKIAIDADKDLICRQCNTFLDVKDLIDGCAITVRLTKMFLLLMMKTLTTTTMMDCLPK